MILQRQILVTGASGFVGSYLVRHLLTQGCQVAVILRDPINSVRLQDILLNLTIIHGTLESLIQVSQELQVFSPEVCYHLSWYGVTKQNRNNMVDLMQNLSMTLQLLQLCNEIGCRKFIGLGSQVEYAPSEQALDENTITKPTTLYGATKLAIYHMAREFSKQFNIRFVWIRLFSTFGFSNHEDTLISYVIKKLLVGKTPALTKANQKWDYLFIEDATKAIALIGLKDSIHDVFNLGSGAAKPLYETISLIRNMIDPKIKLRFGEVQYSKKSSYAFESRHN